MNYLKPIAGLLTLALLTGAFVMSCVAPPAPENNTRNYDKRLEDDPDRSDVLDSSRERSRGTVCEDEKEDDRNHDCVKSCKEIYERRARDDCEELKTDQIERLLVLHELLEDPDDDDLRDIDPQDLDVYLNVSVEPWEDHIDDYRSSEIKEILAWVVEDDEISRIIEKEDDDHQILKAMLEKLKKDSTKGTGANIYQAFTAKIDGGDPLMEVVITDGNDVAMEWFLEFITDAFGEENDGGDNDVCYEDDSLTCLTVYCKIGKGIDKDAREDWLDIDEFGELIEDFIDAKANGCTVPGEDTSGDNCDGSNNSGLSNKSWDTDEIEDLNDVDDDWTNDGGPNKTGGLCGGLT